MRIGTAAFYDGRTARRRDVTVLLEPGLIRLMDGAEELASWTYDLVRREDAPRGMLRLSSIAAPTARLEIDDHDLAQEVQGLCPSLDEPEHRGQAPVLKILAWSTAAAASIICTVLFLVPIAADHAADLVPLSVERQLGEAVDGRVRMLLGGEICGSQDGRAALDKLADALAAKADLASPARIAVLSSWTPNALALPGGQIYLLDGLLKRAANADEIAGVLAHEIGHVAHRDGLRRLIQAGGTSYLLGLLFGDIGGAGAIIVLGRTLLETSYSREVESRADTYAADLMAALGRPVTAMGALLLRLPGDGSVPAILRTHPVGEERMAELRRRSGPENGAPLLDEAEWRALKAICRQGPKARES
jgi:predicted Zn-dependent protease